MAKMNASKKGMLFTIAALLLGSAILSFAFVLSQQQAEGRRTAVWELEADRATDTYSNMEDALVQILSEYSNISVANRTVQISETLPIPPNTALDFDRFMQFESNYSDVSVTMNLSRLKAGSFLIQPGDIAIAHGAGTFSITPPNQSGPQPTSYDIEILIPENSFDSAAWQSLSNSSDNSTALLVQVLIRTPSHSQAYSFNATLDRNGSSAINMTQAGSLYALVQFLPHSSLQISYPQNIGLKASVGFANQVRVEANDTISVVSAMNKTGRVRIA